MVQPPPQSVAAPQRNNILFLVAGLVILVVVVLVIGAVFALNLLRSQPTASQGQGAPSPNPAATNQQQSASAPPQTTGYSPADGPSPVVRSASGVQPDSVTASGTSAPAPDASGNTITYEPEKATDGQADTAWSVDGDGVGQSITLNYNVPVEVSRIGIIPGYDKTDPTDGTHRFYQLYAVRRAEIAFSDGSTVEADFARDPSMQFTDVPQTKTNYVRITIQDSYPPGDSPEGDSYPYTLNKTAISEIQVEGL